MNEFLKEVAPIGKLLTGAATVGLFLAGLYGFVTGQPIMDVPAVISFSGAAGAGLVTAALFNVDKA